MTTQRDIIDYWLGPAETDPGAVPERARLWYGNKATTDEEIRRRFGETLIRAEQGELDDWGDTAQGALALVIVLDQFSRNLYRRTADAFKNDPYALDVAHRALERKLDRQLSWIGRVFLYHPFHHAESPADQDRAVALLENLIDEAPSQWTEHLEGFLKYARDHRDIVARFGRFPHRNAVLGRSNTPEEGRYLENARTYGQ